MEGQKEKSLKSYQKISIILFIIFLLCFFSSFLIPYKILLIIIQFLFYLAYIPYIIIGTLIVLIYHKKILFLNLIAMCLIVSFNTLKTKNFCFDEWRYLTNKEIVDIAFEDMDASCVEREYIENNYGKNITIIAIDCTKVDYEEIKQKYPQCFSDNMANECIVNRKTIYKIENSEGISIFPILQLGMSLRVDSVFKYKKESGPTEDWYIHLTPCGKRTINI